MKDGQTGLQICGQGKDREGVPESGVSRFLRIPPASPDEIRRQVNVKPETSGFTGLRQIRIRIGETSLCFEETQGHLGHAAFQESHIAGNSVGDDEGGDGPVHHREKSFLGHRNSPQRKGRAPFLRRTPL